MKKIFFLSFVFISQITIAQNIEQTQEESPDLYTGTQNVKIPLYKYCDADFTLPINLVYNSNGHVAGGTNLHEGIDWMIESGGYVVREIHGYPDNFNPNNFKEDSTTPVLNPDVRGYYYYYKSTAAEVNFEMTAGVPTDSIFYYKNKVDNTYIEAEPDIYHFNFMGHTGSFVLDRNKVCVFNANHPAGEYMIDVSDFGKKGYVIVIKTGDGTRFTFGSQSLNKLGYTAYLDPRYVNPGDYLYPMIYNLPFSDYQSKWPICEIRSPSGRKITYNYKMEDNFGYYNWYGNSSWKTWNYNTLQEALNADYNETLSTRQRFETHYGDVQLTNIKVDTLLKIDFLYNAVDRQTTPSYQLAHASYPNKLSEINIYDKLTNSKDPIYKCILNYKTSPLRDMPLLPLLPEGVGDSTKCGKQLMFLNKVTIWGIGEYRMSYYGEDYSYGSPFGDGLDDWGYYYPGQFGIDSKFGMLASVTTPAGGRTEYDYESHVYSKKLICNPSTEMVSLVSCPQTQTGGVRLKSITQIEGNPVTTRKITYEYKKNGVSSGTLLFEPGLREYEKVEYNKSLNKYFKTRTLFSIGSLPNNIDDTHISYSDVIVRTESTISKSDRKIHSSYIVYHFADASDQPYQYNISGKVQNNANLSVVYPKNASLQARVLNYDRSYRGKLLSATYFNSEDKPVYKEVYTYQLIMPKMSVQRIKKAEDYYFRQYIHPDNYLLKTMSQIYYDGTDSLVTAENYTYNKVLRLSTVSTTDLQGVITTKTTKYIRDTRASIAGVYDICVANNIWNLPGQITEERFDPYTNRTYITSDRKYTYTLVPGCYVSVVVPKRIVKANISTNTVGTNNVVEYVTEKTFDQYGGVYARCMQTTDSRGVPTTYIWGYYGLYPICKAINTTLDIVAPLLNLRQPFLVKGALSAAQESAVRSIAGSTVTTQQYRPFFGISKATDQYGQSLNYEYKYGFMPVKVTDGAGNPVMAISYNQALNGN